MLFKPSKVYFYILFLEIFLPSIFSLYSPDLQLPVKVIPALPAATVLQNQQPPGKLFPHSCANRSGKVAVSNY